MRQAWRFAIRLHREVEGAKQPGYLKLSEESHRHEMDPVPGPMAGSLEEPGHKRDQSRHRMRDSANERGTSPTISVVDENRRLHSLTGGQSPPEIAELLQLAFRTFHGALRTLDGFVSATQNFVTL